MSGDWPTRNGKRDFGCEARLRKEAGAPFLLRIGFLADSLESFPESPGEDVGKGIVIEQTAAAWTFEVALVLGGAHARQPHSKLLPRKHRQKV